MAPKFCSCTAFDLLHTGCKCSFLKPRTQPINILIPELGFKRAWQVIQRGMDTIEAKRKAKIRIPANIEDLIFVMWDIESYSISLHDDIARDLEDEWRFNRLKNKSSSDEDKTAFSFTMNLDTDWRT